MSGFGLRALKKVKDEEHIAKTTKFYKYIVYGENTYGVLTFLKLPICPIVSLSELFFLFSLKS